MASYQVQTPFCGANGHAIQAIRYGATQNLAYNAAGGASVQSAPFNTKTGVVRLAVHIPSTGSGVRIAVGTNPVASATSTLYPGSMIEFVMLGQGELVAIISDDANTGSINITEAMST
jgi:hypothetical protein